MELKVGTLEQDLWSEMSHDSVYKKDELISKIVDDPNRVNNIKRCVNLMAGQIEVADREFERLGNEAMSSTLQLLMTLEHHYYRLSSRRPDVELSIQLLEQFATLYSGNIFEWLNA
jgi:ppGpp synthetase/RelA/SpoT-type nucleotidyltranferase